MRWSLPAWFLGLCGCLYLGGINRPPEGEIRIKQNSSNFFKLGSAALEALASDPDDDELHYEWRVGITSLDDQWLFLIDRNGRMELAANLHNQAPVIWKGPSLELTLPEKGTYNVDLRVLDGNGAEDRTAAKFKVPNQEPSRIGIVLEGDPAYKIQGNIPKEDVFPAHAHYWARLSDSDRDSDSHKDTEDPDDSLTCGTKARVTWLVKVEAPIDSKDFEYMKVQPCKEREPLDRLRFRIPKSAIRRSTKFTITASVTDGYGGAIKGSKTITLVPNRAPCIIGPREKAVAGGATKPQFAIDRDVTVPILHNQKYLFEVRQVSDDVEEKRENYTYSWWVKDSEAFERVLAGADGPRFTVLPWFRKPGQAIQLRVMIEEPGTAAPDCDEQARLCRSASGLPDGCYQWVTWTAQFR